MARCTLASFARCDCAHDIQANPDHRCSNVTFVLSVVALLLGPFVYAWGQSRPTARQVLDGFVFITIAGIVCVHIIPASITNGGPWALLFLALGLAFPVLLERQFHHLMHKAHDVILVLAALGLAVHAMVDGIALLPVEAIAGGDVDGPLQHCGITSWRLA